MTARIWMIAGATAGALSLAACTPPHPHRTPLKVISALDCPDSQGDLQRKSLSADSKSCVYADGSGSSLVLQLVSLDGKDPKAALAPVEDDLKSELPPSADPGGDGKSSDADAKGEGRVDIDLPGVHIHANGDKDAKIDVGGPGGADGKGGVSIDAHDKNARVTVKESGAGVRLSYILASDTPGPHGFKAVGYEARGPVGGPIAVAVIKSRADDMDDLRDAAHDLLRANVGR